MIGEIYTFDGVIDTEIQDEIEKYVYDENTQWETLKNVTKLDGVHTNYSFPAKVIPEAIINKDVLKFIDLIIENSLNKINKKLLKRYRVKINKTIPHTIDLNQEHRLLHVDTVVEHVTIIYYINDADGDTLIFNDKNNKHLNKLKGFKDNDDFLDLKSFELSNSITPKKGRVVIFDGNLWHYGKYPTKGERNVININLVIEKLKNMI
jgi:hypothetical protein